MRNQKHVIGFLFVRKQKPNNSFYFISYTLSFEKIYQTSLKLSSLENLQT